jgi:predicted DNA-binding transcriptional regulator YafY
MYDPLMRVLTVLEILQAREEATGAELAERLEVSPRTVQRYIARLQDLAIPVEGTRGVGGSYRLKPGFRLPPLMLTDEEAFALSLGLRALRQVGLSAFAPATEGAAAKLGRILPDPVRESVRTVDEVVAMEAGPWTVSTSAEALMEVAAAIRRRRRVSFTYESRERTLTQRELEPYGVLHTDGRWYLVGRCLLRQDLRTFRLDRVSSLRGGEATFERPPDFDVQAYLHRVMPFAQSAYQVEVWMDMPVDQVQECLGPWRVRIRPESGGTLIECGRDNLRQFGAMLLSFGCRLVVRQPKELREVFVEIAHLALEASRTQSLDDHQR